MKLLLLASKMEHVLQFAEEFDLTHYKPVLRTWHLYGYGSNTFIIRVSEPREDVQKFLSRHPMLTVLEPEDPRAQYLLLRSREPDVQP